MLKFYLFKEIDNKTKTENYFYSNEKGEKLAPCILLENKNGSKIVLHKRPYKANYVDTKELKTGVNVFEFLEQLEPVKKYTYNDKFAIIEDFFTTEEIQAFNNAKQLIKEMTEESTRRLEKKHHEEETKKIMLDAKKLSKEQLLQLLADMD